MGDVEGEEAGEKVGYGESDELREGCSSRWLDRTRLSVMPRSFSSAAEKLFALVCVPAANAPANRPGGRTPADDDNPAYPPLTCGLTRPDVG